jgi:hypothetical protein
MGDLNRGETFANGEQVTAARLNKMQDDATLKNGAVVTAHIADGAVTPAKLSGSFSFTAGQVQIASGALMGGGGSNLGTAITPDGTTIEIATATLRVKDGAISTAKIADGAVTLAKLGARAVNAAKFAAVTTARLLGRFSAGNGDFEEISIGSGLSLSGAGVLSTTATTRNTWTGANKSLPAGAGLVQWAGVDGWPFSAVPEYCEARLVCVTADAGFSVGTEVPLSNLSGWIQSIGGAMPFVTAAGAQVHFAAGTWFILNASGTGSPALTRANWRVKLYAEKW